MKNIIKIVILMVVMAFLGLNFVYGVNYPVDPNAGSQTITGVTNLADRIWATAITIVQALAIGCVVFAGLRYMYASADKKADIKKGMMYLAIGSIFVFAATTVIRFIYNAGSELL